ncbi:MAG: PAS domain-containing protein, partial [Firmicutes bacterium]|nr:PAS domain-containing protein [Bacillota bacterium]
MENKGKDFIPKSAQIDQATLEKLAHLFGLCLYKVNLETKEISMNLNTTRITGHDYDDLPRNDGSKDSMIYDEDRNLVNSSICSIIYGQKDNYHIEYRMHRKDSSLVWIEEIGIISERDAEGRPLHMAAIAADMSRLKWAEDKARDMEAEAKRLNRRRDDSALAEENRLLRAANATGAMIVGGFHQEYETVLHQSLQMLGESVQASYAGIWRNRDADGALQCFLRTHWAQKARPLGDEQNDGLFRYDDIIPGWRERLAVGKYVICSDRELPASFLDVCDIRGARSLLFAPFYLHGDFWGMMGFARDDDNPFIDYEIDAVMSGAAIVACSVSRNEKFSQINRDRDKAIANTLAKGEFLSRMSHELRTPLNAIIGMTNVALREKDAEKTLDHLKKVEASSQLLLNIINDILDISKIEAGKLNLVREPFDFNAMLRNAENIVRVKMDEKRQKFTVNYDESLIHTVISDEHRLMQVV